MPAYKILLLTCLCSAAKLHAQTITITDSATSEVKIFNKVEVEASYPGGSDGWRNFLVKNLKANTPVKNAAPAGQYTVIIRFVVSKDGSISNITPETKLGYGMEEEVVRILEKSGKWTPASQGGRNVNAYRRQPVTFIVEDERFNIVTKEAFTLYTGTDNQLTVTAGKTDPADLSLTVPKGTVKALGDGKFIVKINTEGRVTVSIYNTKKDKLVGEASFVVVRKP